MRGTVAKRLMREARVKAMDGSVIAGREYKLRKKQYNNPSYAKVVVQYPTRPGAEIDTKRKAEFIK